MWIGWSIIAICWLACLAVFVECAHRALTMEDKDADRNDRLGPYPPHEGE
jgi:hypothetical protein